MLFRRHRANHGCPMASHLAVALAAACLLLVPLAEARPAPVLYFLKDAEGGPTAAGVLEPYDPKLRNVPNATQPQSRPVLAGFDAVVPVRFLAPHGQEHPTRLHGPLLAGIWLGESTVLQGNLTVSVLEMPPPAAPAVPVPGLPDPTAPAPRVLATATVALDQDLSNPPNVTNLVPPVPPDPASDPAGAATSIVFYEAAQVLPLLLKPPAVFDFGVVDLEVNSTSTLALGFRLDQGSSPGGGPLGVFGQLNYNYALGPSYLYVPWYAPDPPKATTTSTKAPVSSTLTRTSTSSVPTTSGVTYDDEPKDAPMGTMVPMAVLLAALAFAMRRRLP